MLRSQPFRAEFDGTQAVDEFLAFAPNVPAVFVLKAEQGQPYVARTGQLQRRLRRLLGVRDKPSRMLHLREVVRSVEYWTCASRLESGLTMYEVARELLPDSYERHVRLQFPPHVKLVTSNQYPRTMVTSRLSSTGVFYGPFQTRALAEEFEHGLLALFQLRRCEEDLQPRADHPGCMYGEMAMCLRPCQQAVGVAEYASEVARVSEFLTLDGRQLLANAEAARDRSSAEMEFEEAARQHRRIEQISAVLRSRGELAAHLDRLNGVAVTKCSERRVTLWIFERGAWLTRLDLDVGPHTADPVPLDRKLKDAIWGAPRHDPGVRRRQEHIALLARWYFASGRDGEWISYESREKLSYRKLVHSVSRVSTASAHIL